MKQIESKILEITVMHGKIADSYHIMLCYPGELHIAGTTMGNAPTVVTIDKKQAELLALAYGISIWEY